MQLPLEESTYLLKFTPGTYEKAKAVFGKRVLVIRKDDRVYVDVLRIELNMAVVVPSIPNPYSPLEKVPKEASFEDLIILVPMWFTKLVEDCEVIKVRRDITFPWFYN